MQFRTFTSVALCRNNSKHFRSGITRLISQFTLDASGGTRATFGISLTREINKRSRRLAADEWRVILPDARLLVSRTAAADKKLRVPHSHEIHAPLW
jgi:hypothetical protein